MKFCDNCGNLMKVKSDGIGRVLYCAKCKITKPLEVDMTLKVSHEKDEKKVMIVDENSPSEFPVTEIMCPECGEVRQAFWSMQQTRASDEHPTRFYQCRTRRDNFHKKLH